MNEKDLHDFVYDIAINDSEVLRNHLESNHDYYSKHVDCIETLYGIAMSNGNNPIIATLNLFVREYNVKINKKNILKRIHESDCRNKASESRKNGTMVCGFYPFEHGDTESRYMSKYNHMFH